MRLGTRELVRLGVMVLCCCLASAAWTGEAQGLRASADAPSAAPVTAQADGKGAAKGAAEDTEVADVADLPSAPEPNGAAAQSSSSAQTGGAGQAGGQAGGQTGGQTSPAEPSLSDLGFTQQQTKPNAQMQAMLEKRTHMLKVHQTLGLITAVPMFATLVTGPQAKAMGRNGQVITEPTPTNLDVHIALGGLTSGLYYTTAYYAIFAPKIPGVKPKGAIRVHRDLEYIHGPGMILTPILGILAYNQENSGQKVSGIAALHGPVAYVTAIAYGASIVSISWPIHWKFWEER